MIHLYILLFMILAINIGEKLKSKLIPTYAALYFFAFGEAVYWAYYLLINLIFPML